MFRRLLFHAAKGLGLFRLSRQMTARGLRILCFHGFSEDDEHVFRPLTFMRGEVFRKRLAYLANRDYPVLPLGDAIRRLHDGTLPACATAITIDDGFSSTSRHALAALAEAAFPATVYVTTYYCVTRSPIFGLAVQYMFWKTTRRDLDLEGLGSFRGRVSLETPGEKHRVAWDIIRYGETACDEAGRQRLVQQVADRLGVDYGAIVRRRSLDIMSPEELRLAAEAGVDIQVHTHGHRFPADEQEARREIADCRGVLQGLAKAPLVHFCYPSGVWCERQTPWLADMGIETAVTSDPGLNYGDTPALALRRYLDSDAIPAIEFEAEMCGFKELLRRARAALLRHRAPPHLHQGNSH